MKALEKIKTLEKLKKNINKWEGILCSWTVRIDSVKIFIPEKAI